MALSIFLRNPVCTNPTLTKHTMRLATFTAANNFPMKTEAISSVCALKNIAFKSEAMPLANSVRSFGTSPMRMSDEKPHDHAKLWIIEKATSALMVPLIPLGLLMPNRIFDSILAILITAHSFWGMEALVVEYVRVLLFGPTIPKIAMGVVYLLTVLILGGLFYLNNNDIGLCRAFWRIWRNMKKPKPVKRHKVILIILAHCLVGLEAIVVDYVRASIFGPVIPKIAIGLLYLLCIATLGGLFYIISHDVGIANSVRQLWAVRSQKQSA